VPPAQVTFHDTSRQRKRVPLLNDFFGFILGSLSDKVCGWVGGGGGLFCLFVRVEGEGV
jgi:hypothetical protein